MSKSLAVEGHASYTKKYNHYEKSVTRTAMTLSQKLFSLFSGTTLLIVLLLSVVGYFYWRGINSYQKYIPNGTRIGRLDIGKLPRDQVQTKIEQEYVNLELYFNLPDKLQKVPLSHFGVTVDAKALARQVNQDSIRQSYWWILQKPRHLNLSYRYDETNLSKVATDYAQSISIAKVPSRFELTGDTVTVKPGNNAVGFDSGEISRQIKEQLKGDYIKLVVAPKPITTPLEIDRINATAKLIEAKIKPPLDFHVENDSYQTTEAQRFDWLKVTQDEKTNQYTISVDESKINDYTTGIAKKYYKAPIATKISLLDGAENGRSSGVNGKFLPTQELSSRLASQLNNQTRQAMNIGLTPIAPQTQYSRSYSRSNRGISLLMADFAAEKRLNMGTALREVDGAIIAEHNAHNRYVTASVFKAFLAVAILKKIESGSLSMQNQTIAGMSIQSCLEKMILKSDNQTAYALHQIYGFGEIDPFLHSQGFNNTYINNYDSNGKVKGDKTTDAADVANLFTRLGRGELLNPSNTDWLINLMKNQIYRNGIPKGSSPSIVADKVGFLDAYIHDAGIVYSPHGSYSLTILTNGGNWGQIAELSRRIYNLY